MPKLNELDDYDACMGVYGDNAKYCYVKSIIRPPDYSSTLYNFIVEFSSLKKQHYRHDKLTRGICVNKCAKLIATLNDTAEKYYEPPFGKFDPKVMKIIFLTKLNINDVTDGLPVHIKFCEFS